MKARFAVDFDGTLVEDDKYPEIGDWIPGAVEALFALSRIGTVVIHSCRTAPTHHWNEDIVRSPEAVQADIEAIAAKLASVGLGDIEIWTKPFKPPATVYIDNKGVHFNGDWDQTLQSVLDLIFPMPETEREHVLSKDCWCNPEVLYSCACNPEDMCTRSCMTQEPAPERHPNSQRFHDLLEEAGALHDRKQADYGRGNDPFANVRSSAEWGMPAWVGAMVRATDKVRRLQTFADKGELQNESVIDAFMDLAVYALIARVLYEEGS